MMNTNFEDSVREDAVQGLVELAYRRNFNNSFSLKQVIKEFSEVTPKIICSTPN